MNGVNPPPTERDLALDKLSNLPSHLADLILSRLPIRDAVRTSALSSKWRFKWTTMPDLVFTSPHFSFTPQEKPIIKKNLVHLIDHVLLLHTGPISKFELSHLDPIRTAEIDRWILHLSRCLVQEFTLKVQGVQCYKLHSCLFSFQHLVHLELNTCHIKLPLTFGGFKKLKRLFLSSVIMTQDVFETLISSCPILEILTLFQFKGFTHLNIDAPNLLSIHFDGYFEDINFINSSNLEIVSISLDMDYFKGIKTWGSNSFLKFFSSLPRIRRLVIDYAFLQYLASEDMPGQLSNSCLDLGYLFIQISISDYVESSTALCLLRSSPNIQELEILVHLSLEPKEMEVTFWEIKRNNCSFNKLEIVTFYSVQGSRYELEFIRFMLLTSPVLKTMNIQLYSEKQELQLAREILRFQRASSKAEVVLLESLND